MEDVLPNVLGEKTGRQFRDRELNKSRALRVLNLCLQRQKTQHQSGVCWYRPWSQRKLCDDNADEEEADYQADDDEVACEYEYEFDIIWYWWCSQLVWW